MKRNAKKSHRHQIHRKPIKSKEELIAALLDARRLSDVKAADVCKLLCGCANKQLQSPDV